MRSFRSISLRARFALVALATPFVFLAALGPGCSSQAAPVEQGGACEVVTDCAGGLICAPAKGASTCPCTCTSNLAGVQQLPPTADAGTQAVVTADAGAASDDGSDNTGGDATVASDDAPVSPPVEAAAD